MKNVRAFIIGAALLVTLSSVVILVLHTRETDRRTRGTFHVTTNTITILSAPIPTLRPHPHETSNERIDTVATPGHGVYANSASFEIPFDMWVTDIDTIVEHAPLSVIHHLVLFRDDRGDPVCPNRHEQVMVVGADSNLDLHFPAPYGMYFKKGTKIFLRNMAHNPDAPRGTGATYYDVSLGFKLTFERASISSRSKPVALYRIFIDDHPEHCTGSITGVAELTDTFTVPAKQETYVRETPTGPEGATGRFVAPGSGTLLYTGAHSHPEDGGGPITLLKNGMSIATFTPTQIHNGVSSWRTPNLLSYTPVANGDEITLRATYSNPFSLAVPGAMGMGVLVFSPDDTSLLLR